MPTNGAKRIPARTSLDMRKFTLALIRRALLNEQLSEESLPDGGGRYDNIISPLPQPLHHLSYVRICNKL